MESFRMRYKIGQVVWIKKRNPELAVVSGVGPGKIPEWYWVNGISSKTLYNIGAGAIMDGAICETKLWKALA
jgi:hypothetical protein